MPYHVWKKIPYQKKPHQVSKKGALTRNLEKSLKSRLIKNLHKVLYKKLHQESTKVPYQGT